MSPRATLRWSVVRRVLERLRPATVAELGCGQGAMGTRLAALARYTGVEPDADSFAVASRRIGPHGGTVLHGDHRAVPHGEQYDVVCAFEVLEHLEDDAAALADWLPLVRPGGHLVLSVPADPTRFGPSDEMVGHYRRYTADDLRARLTEAGAADVEIVHYGWPLAYLLDFVRDRMAARRDAGGTPQERTSASGRTYQPRGTATGTLIRVGIVPFALLQRLRPGHGEGLVAVATRPA